MFINYNYPDSIPQQQQIKSLIHFYSKHILHYDYRDPLYWICKLD